MTKDQMAKCIQLDQEGWTQLQLPTGSDTPIPGLMLFTDTRQHMLLMVRPDGTTVDLIAVREAAEDLIWNWGKGRPMPAYIGDWDRLTTLAHVLKPDVPLVAMAMLHPEEPK